MEINYNKDKEEVNIKLTLRQAQLLSGRFKQFTYDRTSERFTATEEDFNKFILKLKGTGFVDKFTGNGLDKLIIEFMETFPKKLFEALTEKISGKSI